MKLRKLLLLLILCSNCCFAQRDNVWQLGHFLNPALPKCGLDFTTGALDTFSVYREMPLFITNSSICDLNGNLLFYTNGIYISNVNHDTLKNSEGFNPGTITNITSSYGLNISDGTIIIPFPGSNNDYFVFHESAEQFTANNQNEEQPFNLRYSIVNMSLDGGLGGIDSVNKSMVVINDTLSNGMLSACKHANGRDWWILAHRYYSSLFYKILVTPDTIIVSTQDIGSLIIQDGLGMAVFSPDGTKYSILTKNHLLDLYDFDRCSGVLGNYKSVLLTDTTHYYVGCSFSPNSKYLYASSQLKIFQFDTQAMNIDSSGILVAEWDTFVSPFATVFHEQQIALDGKIYIATYNGCDILHVIDSPDSNGIACNVLQNFVHLPSRNIGLPNFPNYNLGPLTGSPCDSLTAINNEFNSNSLQLKIFPVPVTTDNITVNYTLEQNKTGEIEVLTTTGQIVFSEKLPQWSTQQKLYISELAGGVYFIKLTSGEKSAVSKFIKISE